MKSVYLSSFVLLIWVAAGSLAADGDVGGKCVGDSNTCTDANAYCDDSDTKNKVCSCKAGWVKKGSKCVRGANQPCGPSECMAFGACNDGLCGCDASLGHVLSADNSSCVCPQNQVKGGKDGKCLKTIGQPCTADTECITDAVCNAETKKCQCDTTKFFSTTRTKDNATQCLCDLTKTIQRTVATAKCLLQFGQECTATSQCKAGDGVICDQTCKCDTAKNYEMNEDNSACQCAADHTKRSDKTCGKNANQDCTAGDVCTDHANCNNGKCLCDSTNFWSTSTSENTCFCTVDGEYKLKADGSCGKILGKTCERDSECLDHALCSPDTNTNTDKCTCDASKLRVKVGDNNNECACNENTIEDRNDKTCRKKVGQPCNDVSECVATDGMVCKEVDKTKICTCDTTKHFAAGAAGDMACSCAIYKDMYHLQTADGSCAIKVGKNCSSADAFCVTGAVCDKKSQLCVCDSTNNYATGTIGDTTCSCDANSERIGKTHFCGKKIGGKCTATQTDVCTDHATCTMDMETGTSSCKCSGKSMLDGSCSVASPVVASFAVLMAGLLMASRLI